MHKYPLVLERILNTPLLAHPDKVATVAGVLLRHAGADITIDVIDPAPVSKLGPLQERRMRQGFEKYGEKPYLFDPATGVAAIEVTGSLMHRQRYVGESSGVMGYDGIGAQLAAALDDRDVTAVVFDLHSAGGEVHGAFQLGDRIFAARQVKPVVAISDEMAFSAGYIIAAACEQVWLASETAGVGSVGVVMVHFSFEDALAMEGIKPTIIQAGARKADGNPFENLPKDVAARFQAEIDSVYGIFTGRVARWRGMDEKAVRATEADIFMGQAAVDVGFAEGVLPPEDVIQQLAAETRASLPRMRAI